MILVFIYILVFSCLLRTCMKETRAWSEHKSHQDYRTYEEEKEYWQQKERESKSRQSEGGYDNSTNQSGFNQTYGTQDTNIFSGLSKEQARKRRYQLLKKYHPDNGGSEEMTKKILDDYTKYVMNM